MRFKIGDIVTFNSYQSYHKNINNKLFIINNIYSFNPDYVDYDISSLEKIHIGYTCKKEKICKTIYLTVKSKDIKLYKPILKKFIEEMEKKDEK